MAAPTYKGNIPIAIWENKTKTGEPYLTVQIGEKDNCIKVACWTPKPKEAVKEEVVK